MYDVLFYFLPKSLELKKSLYFKDNKLILFVKTQPNTYDLTLLVNLNVTVSMQLS